MVELELLANLADRKGRPSWRSTLVMCCASSKQPGQVSQLNTSEQAGAHALGNVTVPVPPAAQTLRLNDPFQGRF